MELIVLISIRHGHTACHSTDKCPTLLLYYKQTQTPTHTCTRTDTHSPISMPQFSVRGVSGHPPLDLTVVSPGGMTLLCHL